MHRPTFNHNPLLISLHIISGYITSSKKKWLWAHCHAQNTLPELTELPLYSCIITQAVTKELKSQSCLTRMTLFAFDTSLSRSSFSAPLPLLTVPSKTHSDKRDGSADSCRGTESVCERKRCREAYWW